MNRKPLKACLDLLGPRHAALAQTEAAGEPRHGRKCNICNHPQREAIEEDYLHWRSTASILGDYGIPHHSSLHRHARATGLTHRRVGQLRSALDYILEKAETVKPTANSIIRAVQLSAELAREAHPPGADDQNISNRAKPGFYLAFRL